MDDNFQKIISKVSKNIETFTYPLLKLDDSGYPDIILLHRVCS